MVVIGASIAIILSFMAYWSMPVFAAGGVVLGLVAVLMAIACAVAGAPRMSSVAAYFCLAASVPFWVSRDNVFYFEHGYLWLGLGGLVFAAILFFSRFRHASATIQVRAVRFLRSPDAQPAASLQVGRRRLKR